MIRLKIKQIKQGFEVIKKSEVLTKKEKRELTTRAIIELIVNSYKLIIILPFSLFGIIFATLTMIFSTITEVFDLIEEIFNSICIKIDNLKDINLTKCQASKKVLEEIGKKQDLQIEEKDLKN